MNNAAIVAPGEAALLKLRAREPFAAILAYDAGARTTALDTALRGLERAGAFIVRVANPLRTPLTMERILIQVAGFQTDLTQGEDTDTLMRTVIARLHTGRERLVLSVEQAETLHPMALILLDQIARPLEVGGPAPQILLTGTPAFARMLGHPLLDRMRAVLGLGTPDPVPAPELISAATTTALPERSSQPAPVPQPDTNKQVAPPGANASIMAASLPRPVSAPGPDARAFNATPRTAHQAGPAPSSSRWWIWVLVLLLPALAVAHYAAWRGHLLPAAVEATLTPLFDRLAAAILALRARLLPGAGML